MITAADVLTTSGKFPQRQIDAPPTEEMRANAEDLARRVSGVLGRFGEARKATSGYRPPAVNAKTKGAAKKSNHMICCAIDIEDADRKLGDWCLANMPFLVISGLWIEHPDATKGWVHFQTKPPASGKRVFFP